MNKQMEMVQDTMEEAREDAQERVSNLYGMVTGAAQRVVLVGLGAVDYVREEMTDLVNDSVLFTNKLAERGVTVAKDGRERVMSATKDSRERVSTMTEKPQARARRVARRAEEAFDRYSEQVLNRINVPTAREIEAVDKKLTSLSRKLDKVAKTETSEIEAVEKKIDSLSRKLDRVSKSESSDIEAVDKKLDTVNRKLNKVVSAETN
jgi:poly(hydroxyalkanoate) granule-associated protein